MDEPASAAGGEKYDGVAPGPESRNPLPRAKTQPPHLIWTGFQMADQRSRVFIQTTRALEYEITAPVTGKTGGGATLSVFLRNCRIHLKNNSRKLDTSFFPSPVRGVRVLPRRKDVELRISLKDPVSPTPSVQVGPDGTHFLVLEFP